MVYLQPEIIELSERLGVKLPEGWLESLQRYSPALKRYLEYQVSLNKGDLAVITLGRQPAFLDQIEAHLQELEVTPPALAIFRQMRQRVGQATWGLKLPLAQKAELQTYIKKPLPVAQLLPELQRQGMTASAGEQISAVAAQLEKAYTHFFGADFTPGRPAAYQIYFTQYLTEDEQVSQRLRRVVAALALPSTVSEQLGQAQALLAQPGQTIWVSLSLVEGKLHPSLKVDYSNVHFRMAARVLESLRFPETAYQRLHTVSEVLQRHTADYMSLRLAAEGPPSSSIYLTRIKNA